MRFVIISSGVNCASFIHNCLQSVKEQNDKGLEWKAVFIDDGSTDKTYQHLQGSIKDKRFIIEQYHDNAGAAKRRYDAINKHADNPEDIILLLGLDDFLKPQALQTIKEQYDRGVFMTYGNWIDNMGNGLPKGFLEYPDKVHADRSYRQNYYRSTAPNTFKRFLFDQLTPADFMFNGEWVRATTESNLMFSCLEMCGKERIGVINTPIYIYNKRGRFSTKNVRGATYQQMIYTDVINRPKKQLYHYESNEKRVARKGEQPYRAEKDRRN